MRRHAIRIGLKQVKGIAKADLESIRAARAGGPFTSLADFCRRTTVPRDVVENLVLCGALDSLNPCRRQLLWELDAALRCRAPGRGPEAQLVIEERMGVWEYGSVGVAPDSDPTLTPTPTLLPSEAEESEKSKSRSRSRKGEPTIPTSPHPHPPAPRVPATPPSTRSAGTRHTPIPPRFPEPTLFELAQWEVETLGFSVRTHPAQLFRERLRPFAPVPASELPGRRDGERLRVAGVVLCRMRPPTKSGAVIVFITLEDETGVVDAVIFPRVYEEYGKAAFASDLLVIEGRVQKLGRRGLSFLAEKVFNPLEGIVEDRIDGKTGLARRELPLPIAPGAMVEEEPEAAIESCPAEEADDIPDL